MSDESEYLPEPSPEPAQSGPALPALSRKAEIESLMGDQHSPYWKGPHADALQNEYRHLLEHEEGDTAQPAGDLIAVPGFEHVGDVDILAAEIGVNRAQAVELANSHAMLLNNIPEAYREPLNRSLDSFPGETRRELALEIARGAYRGNGQVSQDYVDMLAERGADRLLREWGDAGARRRCWQFGSRSMRVYTNLKKTSPGAAEGFKRWMDSLQGEYLVAVLKTYV